MPSNEGCSISMVHADESGKDDQCKIKSCEFAGWPPQIHELKQSGSVTKWRWRRFMISSDQTSSGRNSMRLDDTSSCQVIVP